MVAALARLRGRGSLVGPPVLARWAIGSMRDVQVFSLALPAWDREGIVIQHATRQNYAVGGHWRAVAVAAQFARGEMGDTSQLLSWIRSPLEACGAQAEFLELTDGAV